MHSSALLKSCVLTKPVAILCTIALLISACGQELVEDSQTTVVRPAKLVTIDQGSDLASIRLPAVIEAKASSNLSFQVGGVVDKLMVKAGEDVRAGQVLAQLNQRDYFNELLSAKAQFENAQTEFDRAKRLLEAQAIAKAAYDQRKTQFNVASAQLELIKKRLEDTMLKSPFDGEVAVTEVDEHERVSPGQTILRIQTQGAAEAVVQLPAKLIVNSSRVAPQGVTVALDVLPGMEMPAKMDSIATQADATTQTFEAKFEFTPPEGTVILPGMTGTVIGNVELQRHGEPPGIFIPTAAIMSDGEQQFVWLVDTATMTVSARPVTLAAGAGKDLRVTKGLQKGDVIVGAGASYLHEGMQIREYKGE